MYLWSKNEKGKPKDKKKLMLIYNEREQLNDPSRKNSKHTILKSALVKFPDIYNQNSRSAVDFFIERKKLSEGRRKQLICVKCRSCLTFAKQDISYQQAGSNCCTGVLLVISRVRRGFRHHFCRRIVETMLEIRKLLEA
ncbi:hypothetical protein Y032_0342g3035 [Ancylostoma ceylanicum]|nr:hypothetical protein Y032_0342g3035 [Ancylostoma ceylanicum]